MNAENVYKAIRRLKRGRGVPEGQPVKEIAEMIFLETPTLVPAIDKMEKNGLVERRPDPKDRRNNRIFLTKKSKVLIEPVVDFILEFRKLLIQMTNLYLI